ncbi:choice-of-anchor tandem repeat GloVer-containing protein [Adhaeribacter arboris]|nr:choice-of-anchor tandem repeat GloVer-containing protein [Adhaeribacter arboris]
MIRRSLLIALGCLLPFSNLNAQDILLGLTAGDGPTGGGTAFSINTTGENFKVHRNFVKTGHSPHGDLIKGAEGNLYGMTPEGGISDNGIIFKMTTSGVITVLHYLLPEDGVHPQGSLVVGNDGNFYGMTKNGGINNSGTIFKITPTGKLTVLRHLEFATDGAYPRGSLTKGRDGNFYGMTYSGGIYLQGTIFKITPAGTYTVLHNLENTSTGGYPEGNLIEGEDGTFYGMTSYGNSTGKLGTIIKITTTGILTVLHDFSFTDGYATHGSLTKGKDGYFYGMTSSGGYNNAGTVFKISSAGVFTVIKNFDFRATGGGPYGNLTLENDGNFYGITFYGGFYGDGTIFKVTPTGELMVIRHLRNNEDGANSFGSFYKNNDGYLYGMTSAGGTTFGKGTIFKVNLAGAYTVLARLPDSTKDTYPQATLIQAKDGFYYGTTQFGGTYSSGTIFKLCTDGSYRTFFSFESKTTGGGPLSSVIQDKEGNFYGTTASGGQNGWGTIYKLSQSGRLTVLHHFNTENTGYNPRSLIQASDGNYYGMTNRGGVKGFGIIYKITSVGMFSIVRNLESADGTYPEGNLIQGKDGNLYGLASGGGNYEAGTIFKVSLTGSFTVLRHLNKSLDGGQPLGSLLQATDGNLYGMTENGGKNNRGTIFKINSAGDFTILQNFDVTSTGFNSMGSLVQGGDGSFYGLNFRGGKYGAGTIFKMISSGDITVLRHLNPFTDGRGPIGSLIIQKTNPMAYAQSVTTTVNTLKPITLKGSGSSPLVYEIVSQPKNGSLSGSGAKRTYTPNAGFTGTDAFSYRVSWGCQSSTTKTVSIQVGTPVASTIRINAGGETLNTSLGSFTADNYFSGVTNVSTTASSIANTTDDVLYQNNRRASVAGGSFQYAIPVANGLYTVKLHFAEIYYNTTGSRKFNVMAEGVSWLTNYDIVAVAGGARKAVIATKNIDVADGILNVNFVSTVDKACVSAMEVLPVAGPERRSQNDETDVSYLVSRLYPNPVQTNLIVQLNTPTDNLLTAVLDVRGREVLHNSHQVIDRDKLKIQVALLPAGMYLLQIQTRQGCQMLKFRKE